MYEFLNGLLLSQTRCIAVCRRSLTGVVITALVLRILRSQHQCTFSIIYIVTSSAAVGFVACFVSWPEVVKGVRNQGVACFIS